MASKDLYNVFGSNDNSGAGKMMKKRTPRSTENTHEHTSGSFGGQNMVNQLERRDLVKRIGEAGGSVAESARSRPTDQTAASTRRVTTSNTRTATPIGTRQATPLNKAAANQGIPRDLEASEARTDMIGVKQKTPRSAGVGSSPTTGRGQVTYSGYNAPANNQKKKTNVTRNTRPGNKKYGA